MTGHSPSRSVSAETTDRPDTPSAGMARGGPESDPPSVAVLIPTYNEVNSIGQCLDAVAMQAYSGTIEVVVIDGGSTDGTTDHVATRPNVRLVRNPRRVQAAALNIGLRACSSDVVVRVDGHTLIASDYIERCVGALRDSGAAMVGGAMTPCASGSVRGGIAAAMSSRFGAGPARFHTGGAAGWVDTVYLGAYWRQQALEVGGYLEVSVNEDAEFAYRMSAFGGIWFDPSIRSQYSPRSTLSELSRQFFRYGRGRARTSIRHPRSVRLRQLVAPALVVGLISPFRQKVALAYVLGLATAATVDGRRLGRRLPAYIAALPVMHLSWGTGFLLGLFRPLSVPPSIGVEPGTDRQSAPAAHRERGDAGCGTGR